MLTSNVSIRDHRHTSGNFSCSGAASFSFPQKSAMIRIVVEKMLDVSREAVYSVESITKPVEEPMDALNHRTHAGNG